MTWTVFTAVIKTLGGVPPGILVLIIGVLVVLAGFGVLQVPGVTTPTVGISMCLTIVLGFAIVAFSFWLLFLREAENKRGHRLRGGPTEKGNSGIATAVADEETRGEASAQATSGQFRGEVMDDFRVPVSAGAQLVEHINILAKRHLNKIVDLLETAASELRSDESVLRDQMQRHCSTFDRDGAAAGHARLDYNVSVVRPSDGVCLFHNCHSMQGHVVCRDKPFEDILAESKRRRRGVVMWINSAKTPSGEELLPDRRAPRFTIIYFRRAESCEAVLSFELHLNIVHKLPIRDESESSASRQIPAWDFGRNGCPRRPDLYACYPPMVMPLARPSTPAPPAPAEPPGGPSFSGGPAGRYAGPPAPLFFPVEEEMPETWQHVFLRTLLFRLLLDHFGERAAVGSDQFVFWDPNDPSQRCAPDVFVRMGSPDRSFPSWKTWERGAPHLVIEITSASDAPEVPWQEKLERFRRAGVREVIRFNPDSAETPLQIWDAVDGDLLERDAMDPAFRACVTLGAYWVVVPDPENGPVLRLCKDAEGCELLPTAEEARLRAEARVRELEAELAKRG